MRKFYSLFSALIFIPFVSAETSCSLLNLGSCLPQKIYDFFLGIINAPIIPLLDLTKSLLINPIKLELFLPLWAIILYALSLFYGILMMYSGFNFMFSGNSAIKRAKAKEWFVNIFIMIVLIQASYFIYSLVLDIQSLLTAGIMNLIADDFFLLTADNLVNIGLQFFFSFMYVGTLLTTVLLLILRYIIVAVGVIFIPIGIFCYFIPPIKEYGKLIFNFIGTCIFLTFFDALIFLVCSKIVEIDMFSNFKILVMISALGMANLLMFYFMFFSAIKSATKTIDNVSGSVMAVAKYFV
jgi:hypothetical protein